jgi:hypothetical protein
MDIENVVLQFRPYALPPLPPRALPRPLPCPVPRLGAFSDSNAFIVGARFLPALEVCMAAGAVEGGGKNGSSTASSSISSSSASTASAASAASAASVASAAFVLAFLVAAFSL